MNSSNTSRTAHDDRMRITLEPVDGVHVTTLMDNSSDALLPDEGLVRRWGLAGTAGPLPVVPNGMSLGGRAG